MTSNLFLRGILALDAASCAAMGLPMTLAATQLAPPFGLGDELIFAVGLMLLPLAAFIGWLASRSSPPRPLVWLVILGNLAWTVESFWLIAQKAVVSRRSERFRRDPGAGGARGGGPGICRAARIRIAGAE